MTTLGPSPARPRRRSIEPGKRLITSRISSTPPARPASPRAWPWATALVNLFDWQNGISPGNRRTLQFASPSFDVSYQERSSPPSPAALSCSCRRTRRDGERLLRHIASERVERLFCPPVALQALADADPPADLPSASARSSPRARRCGSPRAS
ncbi:MAG: hypothetical protein U0359_28410 [Byssovorax sp.]